jgi:hypothetical protein
MWPIRRLSVSLNDVEAGRWKTAPRLYYVSKWAPWLYYVSGCLLTVSSLTVSFCTFLIVSWLNLITHPLTCPKTHELGTPLQLVTSRNLGWRSKLCGLGGWEWLVSHVPFKNKQLKQTNLERNKCKNWEEINSTTRTKLRKMMLINNFGKINFLQPMGRLGMSSWWACSFPFPDGVGGIFCFFTPFFLICSP